MARVKVHVNKVPKTVISTEVTREGERAIDQSKIVMPLGSAICISDEITISQDAVDLDCVVGVYMMQGSVKDESGLGNDAYGSILDPRVDVQLLWCSTCSIPNNFGFRELTVASNGAVTCVAGKVCSKAMCFDGTNDYLTLSCESIFDIDQTTQLSSSAWIKTTDTSVPIISKKASGTTSKGWEVGLDACGRTNFRITNTATSNELNIRGDTAVNTGSWVHIGVTYNGIPGCGGNAVEIYVNGSLDTKGVVTNNLSGCTLNNSYVTFGAYADGSSKYTGIIDDGRFWVSKKLSDEEIRSVYNNGIISETTGRTGDAMRFNGVDSFQEIPHTTDFDFTGNFDISVWARWSSTALQYMYARRLLSGNGWALSVNRISAGDIVAEIDGHLIKTCGTSYNDFNWHFIRVYRGSDNVVHLEVDDVEKNTQTIASNLTLSSPAMFIGTNHNKTAYFDGDINTIRIYGKSLGSTQATRLYNEVKAVSIMKFGGTVTKINNEIGKKDIIAQSFGSNLGLTEVKGESYNNRSPEFIIDDLIRNNTCLIPHIHGVCSGIQLSVFNADGKLIDIIRDLVQLSGKVFYTDALKRFHLHVSSFNPTCFTFTHGLCAVNFEDTQDDTEIVNDLVVIGENKKYDTVETFSGNACITSFTLTNGAISSRVLIGSTEQTPEEDYNFCVINKTITFTSAPASGSCNITVEYTYEIPLLIRGEKQSSIAANGRHSKRLVMPWIRTRNDGIRFINGYLNRYKEIRSSLKLELGTMKNSLNEGDVVRVVNDIKNIDNSYVVKSLTWKYPEMKTDVLLGEFRFDDLEYEKQIIGKLHDLESALTEIKDIRCSVQLEEIISFCSSINVIEGTLCGTVFVETFNMSDSITITVVTPGIYNADNYGSGAIYGTEQLLEGFTGSGYTGSGYTVYVAPTYSILMEDGYEILKEDGDILLLE